MSCLPQDVIDDIQKRFYIFTWNNKPDYLKRTLIINKKQNGGLDLPHLPTFIKSIKINWVKKLLDPLRMSAWKLFFIDNSKFELGAYIFNLNKESLKTIISNETRLSCSTPDNILATCVLTHDFQEICVLHFRQCVRPNPKF